MKKRLLTILLTLAMLMTLCSTLSFSVSAAGNNPYICVPLSTASIAIDGEKGADYDKAVKIPVTRAIALSDGAEAPQAEASIMWGSDQKLYLYVEVEDSDPANSADLLKLGTDIANTDCVEFYAYWGNGEPVMLYRITLDGVLYCQQNAHSGDVKLVDEEGEASDHFEAAVKTTDKGYAAEFKINTYLANLCEGALVAFKVVVSSTDTAGSYAAASSNYGCAWNAKRYHTKASTTPQTYANMMLVGEDGASADWHKYPSVSVDDLDTKRYNDDKTAQNLTLREATFINDTECIIKFSKAATLQWFNNTPAFIGACSGSNPAPSVPEDGVHIEDGQQWQIGFDLSSAVTCDGGITWKIKLIQPLYKNMDGTTAKGVVRISETQGNDESFYQKNNDFIGHVISMDGSDYLNANKAADGDGWDVAYVDYTVNEKLTWDTAKETALPASNMNTEVSEVVTTDVYFTNPLAAEGETEEDSEETADDENKEDGNEKDETSGKKNKTESEGISTTLIIIIAAAVVVVIAIIVIVVVVSKKKKKK